jgi:hypothetical protein
MLASLPLSSLPSAPSHMLNSGRGLVSSRSSNSARVAAAAGGGGGGGSGVGGVLGSFGAARGLRRGARRHVPVYNIAMGEFVAASEVGVSSSAAFISAASAGHGAGEHRVLGFRGNKRWRGGCRVGAGVKGGPGRGRGPAKGEKEERQAGKTGGARQQKVGGEGERRGGGAMLGSQAPLPWWLPLEAGEGEGRERTVLRGTPPVSPAPPPSPSSLFSLNAFSPALPLALPLPLPLSGDPSGPSDINVPAPVTSA